MTQCACCDGPNGHTGGQQRLEKISSDNNEDQDVEASRKCRKQTSAKEWPTPSGYTMASLKDYCLPYSRTTPLVLSDLLLCGVQYLWMLCVLLVFRISSIRKTWVTIVGLVLLMACTVAPQNSPATYRSQMPRVCPSIDIRNDDNYTSLWEDCEVIEGNLQILLVGMEKNENVTYVMNMSFPKLREVTGYIVLWRVKGLVSLGTLFPRLSVIRGRSLFEDYAFVIYEMQDLIEIGVKSLVNITRGSVHIEKNFKLCYVHTIDWNVIAPNAVAPPLYSENRPRNECGRCQLTNSKDCITTPDLRCWSETVCQKKSYDCLGLARDESGQCCHERCLGGCTGPTSRDCSACKEVFFDGECIQECPPNTFKYMDRRCVTREECISFPYPLEVSNKDLKKNPFRIVDGSCLLECPANYTEVSHSEDGRTYFDCEPCKGVCSKECDGATIDSIMAAQKLYGCTHIRGSLEIHLRHGGIMNLARELERSLGAIEEIEGYLKVVRSFSLISLNFLKNLRLIGGHKLDERNASLAILDNQNLQELWDWDKRPNNFTISRGKLFIHQNPKLCYYKLERFRKIARLPKFSEDDVPVNSNGDKEACNLTEIVINITKIQPYGVIIRWHEFESTDPRKLLGYVVSYVRAPFRNVTQYDGRDACGNDGWHMDDVPPNPNMEPPEKEHLLSPLEPATQYAFFVKTIMVKTEMNGGQSKIIYFTTAPATPMMPTELQAWAESTSEVFVSWQPPLRANGNLTHYVVTVVYEEDKIPHNQNYCEDPIFIKSEQTHRNFEPPQPVPTLLPNNEQCQCYDQEIERDTEEAREKKITFEDALQNFFFVKIPSRDGDKKSVSKREVENGRDSNAINGETAKTLNSRPDDERSKSSIRLEVNGTSVVLRNMTHFGRYGIYVRVCRAKIKETLIISDAFAECSIARQVAVRTKKNDTADVIHDFVVEYREINDTTKTTLRWKPPEHPNGLIHSYKINGTRIVDEKEINKINWCVDRKDFTDGWIVYDKATNLEPGNYSFNVRAISLSGDGPLSRTVSVFVRQLSSSTSLAWIIVAVIGSCLLILALGGAIYYKFRPIPTLIPLPNPDYIRSSLVYIADDWEVPREKIEMIRELGKGSFGLVFEGYARGIVEGEEVTKCAIKIVNDAASNRERSEFLNEASVMKAFHTHHVVRLLGVVSVGQPTLVVMELMSNGDLKSYLRRHRPDEDGEGLAPPPLKRTCLMAMQIADGMAYLAARKFVHRDLAARNCMVAEDLTVKVGDFGMTRDIYETDYYKKGSKGLLPVRWMAPESLKDGVFTSSCDVWSFGVVLWEMITLASQPYLGLANEEVINYILQGRILNRPDNCPHQIYDLMLSCWATKPSMRITFMEIVDKLLPFANEDFQTNSFYFSPGGCEVRAEQEALKAGLEQGYSTQRAPLRATTELDEEDDFTSVSDGEDASNIPLTAVRTPVIVSSSDSSHGSKVSNGSGIANGNPNKMASC